MAHWDNLSKDAFHFANGDFGTDVEDVDVDETDV